MHASHPGRRQVLALLGGAPAFAAARPAQAQGEPRRGGVMRVSAPTNPSTLGPMTGSAGSDQIYLYTLYDTLVEWEPALPYLDGIEIRIIGEVNTGLRSVITGQNDFVYFLAPQQKPIIERAKNLTSVSGPTLWCIQIHLNYGRKPLDDVRVRLALNYAIGRIAFNKATANGLADPAMLHLPASHRAFDQTMADANSYDPDKARRLLAEAGYKDGFDLDIHGTSDQRSIQQEEVLIEQFQKAGIRANFTNGVIPNSTTRFFVEKKHDAYLSSWTGRPDPTQTYQLLFSKNGFYNAGRADPVPELMGALLDTRNDQAIADRKKAFARPRKLVAENALVVPLQFQFEMDAHTTRPHGFRSNLPGKPRFENVWLDT